MKVSWSAVENNDVLLTCQWPAKFLHSLPFCLTSVGVYICQESAYCAAGCRMNCRLHANTSYTLRW